MKLFRSVTILITYLFISSGQINGQGYESATGQGLKAINEQVLKAQLGFLASDWTEGRRTGEKGEFIASDYIASMLQVYGIKPYGDYPQARGYSNFQKDLERTYFQNFSLLKTLPGDDQSFRIITRDGSGEKITEYTNNVDYIIRSPHQSTEIEASVIFAGYGFRSSKLNYDDFKGLDLKGRIILRIAGTPALAKELLTPAEISASVRETEAYVKDMGALGIIDFEPGKMVAGTPALKGFMNMSPAEIRPTPPETYASYTLPGKEITGNLIRISISARTAGNILSGSGIDPEEYIKLADSKKAQPDRNIRDKYVHFKSSLKETQVAVRNVIGIIEGNKSDRIIVIGAHYDHMGISDGYIWNGADDNASGAVGVLTLAKAFMETGVKPDRTIIFAFWTGEEQGLLGSRYYVNNLPSPVKNYCLNLNFDMISRYIADNDTKKVSMTYTSSYPWFRELTETNLTRYNIDLLVDFQPSDDPPGGSDHKSFVAAGIPVMRFKPGHREEYHTPDDEISTVNWDIMEKIIKISFANLWSLANSDW